MEEQAQQKKDTASRDNVKANPMLVTILKTKLLLQGVAPSTLQGLSTDDPLIIEKYTALLKASAESRQNKETLPG
ncbi:MAG: hypothetical protein EHM79_06400 [Geobacter sp.]|nr:MAG: hypothetical protein EHM79_06400 [Geobacter sp.]